MEDMLLAGMYVYMSHLRTMNTRESSTPASLHTSLMMINSTLLVIDKINVTCCWASIQTPMH